MTAALGDLVVLDLSHALAGPFASTMLGDYGAEIIKIEPLEGEIARAWGPPFYGDESAYFVNLNRNKKSVALDLKHPDGKAIFFRLLERADVVLENLRVGTVDEARASATQQARERQPRIIYCSISGFGQDGPYRNRAAFDLVVQAESGMISVTGEPGGRGVRAGVSIADITAGMYAAFGILTALHARQTTGPRAVHRRVDARRTARDPVRDDRRATSPTASSPGRSARRTARCCPTRRSGRRRATSRSASAATSCGGRSARCSASTRSPTIRATSPTRRATRTGRRWSRRCRRRSSRRRTRSGKRSCCRRACRWARSTRSTRPSRTRRSRRAARSSRATHPVAGTVRMTGAAGAAVGDAGLGAIAGAAARRAHRTGAARAARL